MILVSPAERHPQITALGKSSPIPEEFGCDVLWEARGRLWGVQRKVFPGDFMASLHGDRLTRELAQMQPLEGAALILEGYGQWTSDGKLMVGFGRSEFTYAQLFGYVLSVAAVRGVLTWPTADASMTVAAVQEMVAWSEKDEHTSLLARGAAPSPWGKPGSRDWGIFLLQGFPGIGAKTAAAIWDRFGGVPLALTASTEELMEVPGVGKVRAERILRALDGR